MYRETMATLREQTSVRNVQLAGGTHERVQGIFAAETDLRSVMTVAEGMIGPITADVARFIWACSIVASRVRITMIMRQLQHARALVEGLRHPAWGEDASLVSHLNLMRTKTGQAMPLPEVLWHGSTSDPFQPPSLA